MRILVVCGIDPGAPPAGGSLRVQHTVRGLAALGEVHYLQWRARPWRPGASRVQPPHDLPIATHQVVERRGVPERLRASYRALRAAVGMDRNVPFEVAIAPTPRRFPDFSDYDLVWCFQIAGARALERAGCAVPVVVDLVDLPQLEAWRTASEQVARWATRTTLVNPVEAADLGVDLIEGGCDLPPPRAPRPVASRPRLLFLGWMHYAPNEDAAQFLVREIVPELRRRLDSFDVRIVGRAPASVVALADDDVTVTGFVPDTDAELAEADLVIVPLRAGVGTRLKILEAFAHQVPVVSTVIGADGIAAVDGDELLLADDPGAFADACVRLLRDDDLRRTVIERAYALASTRYDWRIIERQIAELALEVARGSRRS